MNETSIAKTAPKAPAGTKPKALEVLASRLNTDPTKLLQTLKATVFQKATDDELVALVVVANEYGLNPFLKELYAFPAKGGGIVPVISVDGWNKMLQRQDSFDGLEFEFTDKDDGTVDSCTVTIYVKGRTRPVKVTEWYDECFRDTDPWRKMPRRMLRNRTLCQGSRVAFGFSGVYDADEAIDVQSTVVMPDKPLKAIKAAAPDGQEQTDSQARTPQQQLETVVVEAGFTFQQFQQWATEAEQVKDADSLGSFDELKEADAKRLLRATAGLLQGLKGGAAV